MATGFIQNILYEDADELESKLKSEAHYYAKDYYVVMLSWQLLALFYVAAFYANFDPATFELEQSGINASGGGISGNYVDSSYLIWLMVLFSEIVLDRIFYLQSSLRGKKMLQVLCVISYHVIFMTYYKLQSKELNGSRTRHNLISLLY